MEQNTNVEFTEMEIDQLLELKPGGTVGVKLQTAKQGFEDGRVDQQKLFEKFLHTRQGKRLLQEHSMDDVGVWQILGEDPNCDLGGVHHQPVLDTVAGTLRVVIMYGTNLSRFWGWGAGGDFKQVDVKHL